MEGLSKNGIMTRHESSSSNYHYTNKIPHPLQGRKDASEHPDNHTNGYKITPGITSSENQVSTQAIPNGDGMVFSKEGRASQGFFLKFPVQTKCFTLFHGERETLIPVEKSAFPLET